jgi:hypothetical protein
MKNLYVIKKITVEKWDYLVSHFFLVGKWGTSLNNGAIPLKTGCLVSLKYIQPFKQMQELESAIQNTMQCSIKES